MINAGIYNRKVAQNSAASRGFSLVEILVVIGISVLLFGLLLKPLLSSLQLTKQAQIDSAAQDSARKVLEIITREVGSAAYVFDNATHSFNGTPLTNGKDAAQYSSFLNVEVPTSKADTFAYAHLFDAKLDYVLARRQAGSGNLTDPTAGGEPIDLQQGSGGSQTFYGSPTPLTFPLAPGTTMVRLFVGLRNPEKPYRNTHEHSGASSGDDNTYVLYRAQFAPYKIVAGNNVANSDLFAVDSNGQPVLDDPDFYRDIQVGEINWLAPDHAAFTAADVSAHHDRLAAWEQIAKPIINAPEIDLLVLPHNSDGSIAYDTVGGTFYNLVNSYGVAHYESLSDVVNGVTKDPVTNDYVWPVVHSSVTFHPAVISTNASPATTSDYASVGIPANAADNGGLPYIPSVYQTIDKMWSPPYSIYLYPLLNGASGPAVDLSQPCLKIAQSAADDATNGIASGQLIEYKVTLNPMSTPVPVYNLSTNKTCPTTGTTPTNYVPLAINAETGILDFSVPALPDPTNSFVREWHYSTPTVPTADWTVNLADKAIFPTTPLSTDASSTYRVDNAHVVPGTLQVYGPDMTSGPNNAQKVLYTPLLQSAQSGQQANQYSIDYQTGIVTLPAEMPVDKVTNNVEVYFIYNYQANLNAVTPTDYTVVPPTNPISSTNPANPMIVKVDFLSRDMIEFNIGVRVYDSGGSSAHIVNLSSQVKVGNSNH